MARAPASCPPLMVTARAPRGMERRMFLVEKNGMKAPRYSPKPTAMVAIPPVMITRKAPQP